LIPKNFIKMGSKFKHNKLEQHRGLLLQLGIIISLLLVLAAFNYKSTSLDRFSGNYVEISLNLDTITFETNNIKKPLPSEQFKDAEFKGGMPALTQYFKTNINYSEEVKTQGIQGRVYVKFTINRYGKVKNPKIIRSIHPLLDKEALILIKNMPAWKPATKGNQAVECEQVLPVVFINSEE
jgi:TonB family protein